MSDHFSDAELKQQDDEWQAYTGNEVFYVFQHRNLETGHYFIEGRRGKNCHPKDGFGSANAKMKLFLSNRGEDHSWVKEILISDITTWPSCGKQARQLINSKRDDPLLLTPQNIDRYYDEIWAYSRDGMLGYDYQGDYARYRPATLRQLSPAALVDLTINTFQKGDVKSQFLLAKMLMTLFKEGKERK